MAENSNDMVYDGIEYIIQYRSDIPTFEKGVITKQIRQLNETPALLYQLENEYNHTVDLNIDGVRRALALQIVDERTTLILEHVEGTTIREAFKSNHISFKDFLILAIKICNALGELHDAKIIHKDINSKNILVTSGLNYISIIDFGISTKLTLKSDYLINPDKLEGSLAYISPEQTCRMNRAVDHRSDLYSLGVVFYELLSGRLPFEALDPMEYIHCHIAKVPESLEVINPKVSPIMSDIVMKLLSKAAEDRYQSAFGLRSDLEKLLNQLQTEGETSSFILAENDFLGKFQISDRLYGRETELDKLIHSFKRVLKGESLISLVNGYSGVGKSTLVHEIHGPITEQRGYFIEGKFDQFQRNIPYQAFVQAFSFFIQQILTESEAKLQEWKVELREALGENGGIITTLIPDFELIVGKYEKPTSLNPLESQNRFNYTFLKCIKVLATKEHPMVFFMDDMQWTDLASLALLKQIVLDESIKHLLLILWYRDNETPADHPLMILLSELRQLDKELVNINLQGLTQKDAGNLLKDSFKKEEVEIENLAKLLIKKTDGNPYYINEFLRSLYINNLIFWDNETNTWGWDEVKINEATVTENVVQFLARRLLSFSADTLKLSQYAASIGNKFKVSLLLKIVDLPEDYVNQILSGLMEDGYLVPLHHDKDNPQSAECRFTHDRFQQAVYSQISNEQKAVIHHHIGKELLKNANLKENNKELFELVGHLNQAKSLLNKSEEIYQLCTLNNTAGIEAISNNAYKDALHFFNYAISLLPQDCWGINFDFTFQLYLAKAEAEYLNLNISEADKDIDSLLLKARNPIEKATLLERKLINYVSLGNYEKALKVSRECLALLGVRIPKTTVGKGLMAGYKLLKVRYLMRKVSPQDLVNLPEVSTQKDILLGNVLSQTVSPAYFFDLLFYMVLILEMTDFSLKKGNSISSPHAIISYAVLNNHIFQKYRYAEALGNAALEISNNYHSAQIRGKLAANLGGGMYHWTMPLRQVFSEFYDGYKFSIEGGDFNYASINVVTSMTCHIKSGRNLSAIYDEFLEYKTFFEATNDDKIIWEYKLYNNTINELKGTIGASEFVDFEKDFVQVLAKNKFNLGYLNVLRSMNHVYFGNFTDAIKYSGKAASLLMFFNSSPLESYFVFFRAIAHSLNYQNSSPFQKIRTKLILRKSIKQYEKWEAVCPENFEAYGALLRAERYRILGNTNSAIAHYKLAISESISNKFTHIAALANELLGRFCMHNNLSESTDIYLNRAVEFYGKWGADAKVRQLQEEFPYLASQQKVVVSTRRSGMDTESATFSSANLDLASIMKASTALSGKVKFDDLLLTLMKVLAENAGAQTSYFILENKPDFLEHKAAGEIESNAHLLFGLPDENSGKLPISLLHYVLRTKETIVVDNAKLDTRFSMDPYIVKHSPKSLMCLPVLAKNEVTGLIYLENNLIEGAFTANRIEMLKLLSGQISVSLENSLLYENLEEKVQERTKELSVEKQKSDDLLRNILPEEIADELKNDGKSEARLFKEVTVMFTDFVNFTRISETLTPEELVNELDYCFHEFDKIIVANKLEKIKTIGDSYLAVCGLPMLDGDHATRVIKAAKEISLFMKRYQVELAQRGKPFFEVRIGVHSGPVVAGIVGFIKFQYDIWGDTVNTASRMESTSEPGKINISGITYNFVKDKFNCKYRGKIEAKNKGLIDMYFVED